MPELEFVNVRKSYDSPSGERLLALDNFTLKVDGGRFVTVVGPSGCGKTTLLRMAGGLIPSDSGEVGWTGSCSKVEPENVDGVPGHRVDAVEDHRRQRGAGHPATGDAIGRSSPPRRIGSSTPRSNWLGSRDSRALFSLSAVRWHAAAGGTGKALVRQPEILLMDEPFGALDAQTRTVLQDELLTLWARVKSTVLFITHDLDEAIYLSDTVVIMGRRPGRIKEVLAVNLQHPRYGL